MLGRLNEIVLPAFTDEGLRRRRGNNEYYFRNVERLDLGVAGGDFVPALCGRFINRTAYHRQQVADDATGEVRSAPLKVPDAPSAVFVLLLENHRLLYMGETARSPALDVFETTLSSFLQRTYLSFLLKEADRLRGVPDAGRVTKKSVRQLYDPPTLSIIPLANTASLAEFVARYNVLRMVQVRIASVNAEADYSPMIAQLRSQKDNVNAANSTLTHRNPLGLNKDHVVEQFGTAAASGNTTIKLSGVDVAGAPLDGDNKNFRLKVPIANPSKEIPKAAGRMFEELGRATARGGIVVSGASEEVKRGLRAMADQFRRPE